MFVFQRACIILSLHSHIALSSTIGSFKAGQYHPVSARIFWEAIEEESDDKSVTEYRVQVEGPDSTQVIPRSDDITSLEILYLRPSTQYIFKVSPVTVADNKPRRGETSMPWHSLFPWNILIIYYTMIMCTYIHMHYIICTLTSTYTVMHTHTHTYADLYDTYPWLRSTYGQSRYSWKSFFTAISGKNTAQYRKMLEYTPSLEDALADRTNATWLATELEKAGLIAEYQRKSLETSIDADTRAAELISMVTTKVDSNSENFTRFVDVLKKDKATYGHILAKMKDKGMYVCTIISCADPCKF